MTSFRFAIIGAGRMGQGIGNALAAAGQNVTLLGRRAQDLVAPFSLADAWTPTLRSADVIFIATPDAAIESVANEVAGLAVVGAGHVVFHLAGPLDHGVLSSLAESQAGLGSFHPLQTVADPVKAAESLRGAFAGLEGDEKALAMGRRVAKLLSMTPFVIPRGGKAKYHAGAVMAANYTIGLVGAAQRFAVEAGIDPETAARIYLPLIEGAMSNLARMGPVDALTGPIRRGDIATLRLHLQSLSARDQELYRTVGQTALQLARAAGLAEERAKQVEALLFNGVEPVLSR